MTVRIAHASIDENGKAAGGRAGDQTTKELCCRDWYSKGWNVLLRPIHPDVADISAIAMEAACFNDMIGYDQQGRNTLYAKAKECGFDMNLIDSPCECDCSSLVHVCAIAGGARLEYGANGFTTRTMVQEFLSSGDYVKLTDSKYLTSDKYLQRGDILVKEGSHTVMVLTNGEKVTVTNSYASDVPVLHYSVRLPMLTRGIKSDAVRAMQQLLIAKGYSIPKYGACGNFNEETEAALLQYQKDMNLKADAKCGPDTWRTLLGLTGMG